MNAPELKQQINCLMAEGKYAKIKPLLLANREITEHDNDLAMLCYLCVVYEQENAAGQDTIFSKVSGLENLLLRYTKLKFYLRRIDFDVIGDSLEEFYRFLSQEGISSYELLAAIDFSTVHKEKVLQYIKAKQPWEVGKNRNRGNPVAERENSSSLNGEIQEICFIICTNNLIYAEECIYYINHLIVPDRIRIDILTVEQANSLTSGYNEAMQYSNAKYKVYLHHDTFIVNPFFIRDCLDIFKIDPQIGMIGNVGVKKMPVSGVMWEVNRYGMLYEQHLYEAQLLSNAIGKELKYLEVEAIDGFLMVTQYDIPWREDLFNKWDFYDCSQSMEFIRKGYRVVVPNMTEPWCVHDCGFVNLENYEEERIKFVKEYLEN